jgi:hypothetical protein
MRFDGPSPANENAMDSNFTVSGLGQMRWVARMESHIMPTF